MPPILFNNLTEKDKSDAVKKLIQESSPRADFFLMVILSVLMATFGLLLNSDSVVIGSMLIAPILFPILSVSLGVTMSDFKLIYRSLYTLLKYVIYGIFASAVVTLFFKADPSVNSSQSLLISLKPSLIYIAIAIVAGIAASFSMVKPRLSEMLPGVAISVALIPPLAATGIGIAHFNWNIISNSFMLLAINFIGVIFASMMVFSLMNLYLKRQVAQLAIAREDKDIKREIQEAKERTEENSYKKNTYDA